MVAENPYRAGPTPPLHLTMRTSPSRYFLAALGVLFVCFFVPPILTHPTLVEIECAAAGPGVASCGVREVRLIGTHASKIDVRGVTEVRAEGPDESTSLRVAALAPTGAVPFSRAFAARDANECVRGSPGGDRALEAAFRRRPRRADHRDTDDLARTGGASKPSVAG